MNYYSDMRGQVFKIHSDFYYVDVNGETYECKIRELLKKQKKEILVGDFVELQEPNEVSKQAFISSCYERSNFIMRPKVANIDQIVIVTAIKQPDLSFEQLNRYLCLCEYCKVKPLICFNKEDLKNDETDISKIKEIYENLGYTTIFTSALKGFGIEDLKNYLQGKISVFCGASGVGKTTLINILHPELNLRTGDVSLKTQRGTHTTRHSEIVTVKFNDDKFCKVVDTPGFSRLKFDFLMPQELSELFVEIKELKSLCKYKDCTHTQENDCNVLKHLDDINISRYESYCAFLKETMEFKEKVKNAGNKKENNFKINKNKEFAKISSRKRIQNRKNYKDTLRQVENK